MNKVTEGFFATRIGSGAPLRHGEFVPKVLEHKVRRLCPSDLEDPDKLRSLYDARNQVAENRGKLFYCETEMRREHTRRISILDHAIALFEETPRFENLPTLDPSFLSWKNSECLPGFSIFQLDSDTCKISYSEPDGLFRSFNRPAARAEAKLTVTPWLPPVLAQRYLNDGLKLVLADRCDQNDSRAVELEAKYSGAMPDSVRENINKWRNRGPLEPRFDQMFIVAEAPSDKWNVKLIPKTDPLVIGVVRNLVFLVDAFDLTPTEKFVTALCTGDMQKINN